MKTVKHRARLSPTILFASTMSVIKISCHWCLHRIDCINTLCEQFPSGCKFVLNNMKHKIGSSNADYHNIYTDSQSVLCRCQIPSLPSIRVYHFRLFPRKGMRFLLVTGQEVSNLMLMIHYTLLYLISELIICCVPLQYGYNSRLLN